jgi:hypothetical protein
MKIAKAWRNFYVPIYGGDVFIYRNRKAFDTAMKSYGSKLTSDGCAGRCAEFTKKQKTHYLVGWFNNYKPTLVHEIGHLAMFILMRVNINPTDSNGEAYSYLLAQLYAEATE